MRKQIISVALLAVLSLAPAGCQKEQTDSLIPGMEEANATYSVCYYIDGVMFRESFQSETEYIFFFQRMAALAAEGKKVTFYDEDARANNPSQSKEVVTYTTTDADDAAEWAMKKAKEGYSVTITFDDKTGIFTCIAIK